MIEAHEAFEASKTSFRITDVLSHGVDLGELKGFLQISLNSGGYWHQLTQLQPRLHQAFDCLLLVIRKWLCQQHMCKACPLPKETSADLLKEKFLILLGAPETGVFSMASWTLHIILHIKQLV